MRAAFINALIEMARTNERIYLLVGDVGYSLVEPFAREFPDRFINAGIAEQNMIGSATGLALCGKVVFVYSLANFPTLRCLEQIRNDVCYHKANVKIIAAGGGLNYGALGMTHHTTEDLAVMRALPNMAVIAPADPIETALAIRAVTKHSGPDYLRLGRTGDPVVHQVAPKFKLGKAIVMREGNDITLIATGGILYNVIKAAEQLSQRHIYARVLSMHTVKPLDVEAVLSAKDTGHIMTIEEHSIIGGLGSAVAEVLAESNSEPITFKRIGISDSYSSGAGSQEYLRGLYSLSVDGIVKVAESMKSVTSRKRS
ncbi:MAG: transketolase C-terminal domain-containing protein [Chloroflexota bacterium]